MEASERQFRIFAAVGGLASVVLLAAYFALPPPTPPANATTAEVTRIATQSGDLLYLFAWLQVTGSLLSAIFLLALIHLAKATSRFSGLVAQTGVAVLLALVLIEGALTIDVAAATANGHPSTSLTSYDLMGQFVHLFPIVPAPMIFAALLDSTILPRPFAWLALALGVAFVVVGSAGLFDPSAAGGVTGALADEELWIGAAAVALLASAVRSIEQRDLATHSAAG